MKKILHKIAHWLHLNSTEEVIVFNQSKGMQMSYRNECLEYGRCLLTNK